MMNRKSGAKAGRLDDPVWSERPVLPPTTARNREAGAWQARVVTRAVSGGALLVIAGAFLPWMAVPSCVTSGTILTRAFSLTATYGRNAGLESRAVACVLLGFSLLLLSEVRAFNPRLSTMTWPIVTVVGVVVLDVSASVVPAMTSLARLHRPLVGIEPVAYGLLLVIIGALVTAASGWPRGVELGQ